MLNRGAITNFVDNENCYSRNIILYLLWTLKPQAYPSSADRGAFGRSDFPRSALAPRGSARGSIRCLKRDRKARVEGTPSSRRRSTLSHPITSPK